jgi:two-component system response regulator ChvI
MLTESGGTIAIDAPINRCAACPHRQAAKPIRLFINNETNRAYWHDVDINLTQAEFRVVAVLARQPGEYVSYRTLYDVIQSPGFIAGTGRRGHHANVRSVIKRIRKKFITHDPGFNSIINYTGFGYALSPN